MRHVIVWILGRGGLLGSQVAKELAQHEDVILWDAPVQSFAWQEPQQLADEFSSCAKEFRRLIERESPDRWLIVWAAGTGIVGSTSGKLSGETLAWQRLLETITSSLAGGPVPGTVFLASSAGAVYGNWPGDITEDTPTSPISAYGREKLRQEEMFRSWLSGKKRISGIIGRISNLYGEQQNLSKAQGLISHLSRCIIVKELFHLYVPLDTIRDYLSVRDCARYLTRCLIDGNGASSLPGHAQMKIIASERVTTIAEVIALFAHITHQQPRIVIDTHPRAGEHVRSLRFRSIVWPEFGTVPTTSLLTGISRLHRHQLSLYQNGQLH